MKDIYSFIEGNCEKYASSVFLKNEDGEELSYTQFWNQIKYASKFINDIDYDVSGHNFSIIAPNCSHYLFLLFALLNHKASAVNLNPSLSSFELKSRLDLGRVSIIVTTKSIYKEMEDSLINTDVAFVILIDEKNFLFIQPETVRIPQKERIQDNNLQQACFYQFTGGTTGKTKAAIIHQESILSNIRQLDQHFVNDLDLNKLKVLVAFPFYHIFSIVFNVLFFLSEGGTCVLYQNLRDSNLIVRLLLNQDINFTVGVHTWYKKLMQHPEFDKINFRQIRASIAGGEYVPLATKQLWLEQTGNQLYSGYGLTETASLCIVSPINTNNIMDSIGVPIPGIEHCLLDENNGEIVGDGVVGELALKGPQVFTAYFENSKETRTAFVNGWFKTGDIVERIKGNYFKIIDRKKEMISVSGNKVYPNEVEEVILQNEGVLDVGVVGRKSKRSGEEVVAFVVLKENTKLNELDLLKYCSSQLTRFKVPREIIFKRELPKTPIGKTARRVLRESLQS